MTVVDVTLASRTPQQLGALLHFGQVSAAMAGKMAGQSPETDATEVLERLVGASRTHPVPPETIPDGTLKREQNILTVEEQGTGKLWTFQAEGDIGFTPSHLRAHMLQGEAVTVHYKERTGRLVAVKVED